MALSEQRLQAYLAEIEDLEQRLKLVSLVERRNDSDPPDKAPGSDQIRSGWHKDMEGKLIKERRREAQNRRRQQQELRPVRVSPVKKRITRAQRYQQEQRQKRQQRKNRNHEFVASQSLKDLEITISANKTNTRQRKRKQQKYNTHALTAPSPVGVPDFVQQTASDRPSTTPNGRRRRRTPSGNERVRPKTPQMSARMQKLCQPGSGAIDYEDFKKEMQKRAQGDQHEAVVLKTISRRTQEWIDRSSKLPPTRRTKKYEAEFKNQGGFGSAGSRFIGESEFNRTPGPSKYIPERCSLNSNGGRISTANPKSELDWIFLNAPKTPGPAQYGAPELPKSRGVKFGSTAMPTELEVIMLRASRTPGPSEYQDMKNSTSLSTRGCGKISDANVPGQIELAIRSTRENPGPGNYVLPSTMLVGGGKFNDANPESYLAKIIRTSGRTPGPNQYQDMMNSSSLSTRGCGKISDANVPGSIEQAVAQHKHCPGPSSYTLPSTMLVGGGKFNDANPESYLETIIRTANESPGPNQYQDMKNNSSLSTRGCGKISDANVPGSIDQAILRTKENPGPSHYRVEDVDFDSVTHQ